jgi:sigma-E factor negative regulatory protein RseA
MSDRRPDDEMSFEALSALADGEAGAPDVARACAAWRDDAKARAHWSSYHLIGDVMRSDELADTSGSARFLKNFHERLAQEPVILAPAGLVARHQPSVVDVGAAQAPVAAPLRRRVWAGPMAVAACFVMVVGALVTSQGGLTGAGSPAADNLAQSSLNVPVNAQALVPSTVASWSGNGVTASALAEGASFTQVGSDPASAASAPAWRDPQFGGGQSFASPGLVRNVLYETP